MHVHHMMHIFHVLTIGYHHIHGFRPLMHYYLHHHAIAFLRSGFTSESPGTARAARQLLWWLATHHVAPVDW